MGVRIFLSVRPEAALSPAVSQRHQKLMISNYSERMSEQGDRLFVKLPVKEHCVKVARLYFPEQTVSISQQSLGDLVWGKSSRGAAWHLNKTTSQSPWSNPPSQRRLPNWAGGGGNYWEREQAKQTPASFDLISAVSCYKLPFVCLPHSAQQSEIGPDSFSTAAWWYLSWWLYLQARHFSTEVLFTHPHVSDALRSVHATSCSRCSPFSVVITHPRGSGWMCTALTVAQNGEHVRKGRNKAPPLRPFLNSTRGTFTSFSLSFSLSLSRSWGSPRLSFIFQPWGKDEMSLLVFLHTWAPRAQTGIQTPGVEHDHATPTDPEITCN